MWLTTAVISVMFYTASLHGKRFVYIISSNQPKVYSGPWMIKALTTRVKIRRKHATDGAFGS